MYDEEIAKRQDIKERHIAKAVALEQSVNIAIEKREWDTEKIIGRAKEFCDWLKKDD